MTYSKKSSLILLATLSLVALGIAAIYSSSVFLYPAKEDSMYMLKKQLIYAGLGTICLFIATYVSPFIYKKYAYHIFFASVFILLLILLPGVGTAAGGAKRWLSFNGFSFQPSELFKVALVIYLSMSLAKKGKRMRIFHIGIIPHIILPSFAMVLILLQPDFGTTIMIAAITFIMLLIGGAKSRYLFGAIIVALPIAIHSIASTPYRLKRVLAFLDPWQHRDDIGFQVVESLISLGSGQITGAGFGNGLSKLHYLPAAHTDFIFSVIGEELGFLGVTFVITCFLIITICGILIAHSCSDHFLTFLAIGITTTISLQAIFNIFVALGLAPTKGISLPFVSFGGSNLLVCMFMIGILLHIDRISHEFKNE